MKSLIETKIIEKEMIQLKEENILVPIKTTEIK